MIDKSYEAYESNSGSIQIYAAEEREGEIVLVWGASYYGERDRLGYTGEEYAGMDWHALMVQGLDPLREGWEGMEPDEIVSAYSDDVVGSTKIADSGWSGDDYPLGVDLDSCCEAGKLFAIAAGAAYRCPECGEVCQTVRDTCYPNSWTTPPRCDCCGADLTDHEL